MILRFRPLHLLLVVPLFFANNILAGNINQDLPLKTVSKSSIQTQINAVKGIVQRRLPLLKDQLVFSAIPLEGNRDVFEVKSKDGKILISGSSGVAMAVGLSWYIRNVCNRQISWCGSNLEMNASDMLPVPNGSFRNVLPHRYNVYLNYCTISYSMPWWDWERWEWEIDFMALNGITMPLSVIGNEAVWYNSLLRMGFTDLEARKFLVAPSHFAWQLMQNIENNGEPLPMQWIKTHIKLGKQIINRQREFGMSPIQQGFSGYVPSLFKVKFPSAKIRQQPKWCNFEGVYQLDPLDPLFKKFGRIYMEEESKLFGLSGFYAADPFHESAPPGDIPKAELKSYLHSVGQTIHQIFNSIDTNSTWVMQSWSIRKDIALAAPKGRLLVIDLEGQKWKETDGFWGHNFCIGQLHNFGSRINLHGDLKYLVSNPFIAAQQKYPSTAVGTGIFPEGIVQNPVFYDCYFDMIWRSSETNLDGWLNSYVTRRYGQQTENAVKAWSLLKEGPYKPGTNGVEFSSIIAARPALDCKKSGPNAGFNIPYSKSDLVKAWQLLLADKELLQNKNGYQFDVMDIGRQSLSNLAQDIHAQIKAAFENKDFVTFKKSSAQFIELLYDVDRLCDTRKEYSFPDWLSDAKKWGRNNEERNYYDRNASMLVTYWGPDGDPQIFDYSWREWSGLIADYYVPRWKQFFEFLSVKLSKGESYSEKQLPLVYGREAWRANEFYSSLASWEEKWVKSPKSWKIRTRSANEAAEVSLELLNKWKPTMDHLYGN